MLELHQFHNFIVVKIDKSITHKEISKSKKGKIGNGLNIGQKLQSSCNKV